MNKTKSKKLLKEKMLQAPKRELEWDWERIEEGRKNKTIQEAIRKLADM